MDKTKRLSMKCHTVNGRTFRPVAAIAGNGVTKIFHMDTDLVLRPVSRETSISEYPLRERRVR